MCITRLGSFRWNLAYAHAYIDLLREKNTIYSLKSIAEVVLQNKTIYWEKLEGHKIWETDGVLWNTTHLQYIDV
jgi:hypothetical protein